MKTENWNGHDIRFVEVESEWWAVAKDISEALDYAETRNMIKIVPKKFTSSFKMDDQTQKREYIILSEFGIYKAIFGSHKKEAEQFQEWIFDIIKELRQSANLEGFEIFRMLDREHQREQMNKLCRGLKQPKKSMFIKANMITNKAISIIYGFPKAIKKKDMTPEMLAKREPILEEVVGLMEVNDRYDLGISISQKVYENTVS